MSVASTRYRLLLVAMSWLIIVGCRGCFGGERLAVLVGKVGEVQRDHATAVEIWGAAVQGSEFFLGDALRTFEEGHAELLLDDGSQLSLQPETTVRFLDKAPETASVGFDVATGVAVLEAGSRALVVETRLGLATIEPGSLVRIQSDKNGLRFLVQVGRATFGDEEILEAGGTVGLNAAGQVKRLPNGNSQLEKTPPEVSSPVEAMVKGDGVQLRSVLPPDSPWVSLSSGASVLPPGSELQLSVNNSVSLKSQGEHATLSGTGRYQVAPRKGVLVATQTGKIIAGGSRVVRVAVPGGVIVVVPNGKSQIVSTETGTRILVLLEAATISHGDENQHLQVGQSATLSVAGNLDLVGVGRTHADIAVSVGESWVVHDPQPPTDIRFEYPDVCERGGAVELLAGKRSVGFAAGVGKISLQVARGSYSYRLRCLENDGKRGRVVQSGRLSVVQDAGTRGLPAKAPVSQLLADGRQYTVLFQNRLPVIDLTWKAAPTAVPIQLKHRYRKKEEILNLSSSQHRFKSGKLREGQHVFFFQGGGKISRRTTVNIRFDNAAPTASLDVPATLSAVPGEDVSISGIALPGSRVLVDGKSPTQDRHGRFRISTQFPGNGMALAVSIRHPRRGNHVYLRRSKIL